MLVTYKGSQSALHLQAEGRSMTLLPNVAKFVNQKQADAIKSNGYLSKMIDSKQLELQPLDKLNKDELLAVAHKMSIEASDKTKNDDIIKLIREQNNGNT